MSASYLSPRRDLPLTKCSASTTPCGWSSSGRYLSKPSSSATKPRLMGQFPVSPLAPLAAPTAPSPTKSASGKYPLAIFSHGLAGTRNAYSQYCSALASLGYVVLVVEHRDGTGPSVLIPDFDSNEKGKMKTRLWIKLEDLT